MGLYIMGFGLILNSIALIFNGLNLIIDRTSMAKNKTLHPEAPWLADFNWKQKGVEDDRLGTLFEKSCFAFPLSVFCGLISWGLIFNDVWFDGFLQPFLVLLFGFIDYFIINLFFFTIYQGFQFFKYNSSKLKYTGFPFFIGQSRECQLVKLPKIFINLTLNLRFIEEIQGPSREGWYTNYFELYRETKILERSPMEWDRSLNIEWKLPDDHELKTVLNSKPPRYWELEVKAETPGIDYLVDFSSLFTPNQKITFPPNRFLELFIIKPHTKRKKHEIEKLFPHWIY